MLLLSLTRENRDGSMMLMILFDALCKSPLGALAHESPLSLFTSRLVQIYIKDYLMIIGLLKKDIKKIHREVQKTTATYLRKLSPYKVDVRTPQSALLTNGSISDDRGPA